MTDRLRKQIVPSRGRNLQRLQVLMVMERFIARVHHVLPDSTLLKGGLALELRLDQARTTKDIDLRLCGDSKALHDQLRAMERYRPSPDDHFLFTIKPGKVLTVTGPGAKYDGHRFNVHASLAGKRYATFGLDVAYGDPIYGEPLEVTGSTFFEKYGIAPITARVYPATTHLAEKLHAYTFPHVKPRVNSRVKDLIDMPLLGGELNGTTTVELRAAFQRTFEFRETHGLPAALPSPPAEWLGPYDRLCAEQGLPWPTLAELHAVAAALIDPVLGGVGGEWSVAEQRWCN